LESESDAQLVRRCLAGEQAACTRLVSRHARVAGTVIWRAVRDRELVEDLCQEAFLRVFRGLQGFDGRARLSTWICSIAHRVAVDELRRQGRTPEIICVEAGDELGDLGAAGVAEDAGTDPLQQAIASQDAWQLQAALDSLPDRYRLPLAYVALQELGYDDVAMMLGIPTGTVKTLVFRGKALLRERLQAAVDCAGRPSGFDSA
jgi:RNA polymerase sigma factor (sigma-70 family)